MPPLEIALQGVMQYSVYTTGGKDDEKIVIANVVNAYAQAATKQLPSENPQLREMVMELN